MQADLALALGFSVAQVKRLSEREFRFWYAYRARRMLPARRIEVLLAQLALVMARTMGGSKTATIEDFLIPEVKKTQKTSVHQGAMAISAFSGAGVRRLGQGRKGK